MHFVMARKHSRECVMLEALISWRNERCQMLVAEPCSSRSPFMRHTALQSGALPSIPAVADFYRGIAFFLPALPYQPFPLEGFD